MIDLHKNILFNSKEVIDELVKKSSKSDFVLKKCIIR